MSQVNLDDPKKHSDSNFEVLQTWIDQIMSGQISLDGELKEEKREGWGRGKGVGGEMERKKMKGHFGGINCFIAHSIAKEDFCFIPNTVLIF